MTSSGTRLRILLFAIVPALLLLNCGFFSDPKEPSNTGQNPRPAGLPANPGAMSAPQWLDLSLVYFRQSRFMESAFAAQTAANLKPDYTEAWNNIGAAYAALHIWDQAILADQNALRLKPDYQLARNNLAWAVEQKRLGVR
jgi:tetratricopeptide (TPR) repeat protein